MKKSSNKRIITTVIRIIIIIKFLIEFYKSGSPTNIWSMKRIFMRIR